jgi:hypothetical protein
VGAVRRLALALLLAGCGEAVPVYLTETEPGPTDEAIDLLDEAFAFWGADYYLTDETGHGVLSIALVEIDDSEEHRGYTERDGDCGRRMWVDRDPVVLRHELGHAWNLRGHSDDPEHLMSVQGGDGETVTDEQWDTAQDTIDRFIRCWQ